MKNITNYLFSGILKIKYKEILSKINSKIIKYTLSLRKYIEIHTLIVVIDAALILIILEIVFVFSRSLSCFQSNLLFNNIQWNFFDDFAKNPEASIKNGTVGNTGKKAHKIASPTNNHPNIM